jgi:hypothetical protein
MALVSAVGLVSMPIASEEDDDWKPALRRRASSRTSCLTGQRAAGAGASHQPAAPPCDVVRDRQRGMPVLIAELPRCGLLRLRIFPRSMITS